METDSEWPWYIVKENATSRFYWDVFIIFMALVNAITLPLELAFFKSFERIDESNAAAALARGEDPPLTTSMLFFGLNYFSMAIFLVDIVMGFFTSYLDIGSGDEIYEIKKVAKNYVVNGTFIVDLLSTFPLKLWGRAWGVSENIELLLSLFGLLKI